jgi:hypothetical protein
MAEAYRKRKEFAIELVARSAAAGGIEQRSSLIAAEGDEVQVSQPVAAMQTPWHGKMAGWPTLCSAFLVTTDAEVAPSFRAFVLCERVGSCDLNPIATVIHTELLPVKSTLVDIHTLESRQFFHNLTP